MWRTQRPHPGDEAWTTFSRVSKRLRGVTIVNCLIQVIYFCVYVLNSSKDAYSVHDSNITPMLHIGLPWLFMVTAYELVRNPRMALYFAPLSTIIGVISLFVASSHLFYHAEITILLALDMITRYIATYYAIRATEHAFTLFHHQVAWAPMSASIDLRKLKPLKSIKKPETSSFSSSSMHATSMSTGELSKDIDVLGSKDSSWHTSSVKLVESHGLSCFSGTTCVVGTCLSTDCSGCMANLSQRIEAALNDPLALLEIETSTPLSIQGMVAFKPLLHRHVKGFRRELPEIGIWIMFQFISAMSHQPLAPQVYSSLVQNEPSV